MQGGMFALRWLGLLVALAPTVGCGGSQAVTGAAAQAPEAEPEAELRCLAPDGTAPKLEASPESWPSQQCLDRADALLAKMTLAEKAGQMLQPNLSQLPRDEIVSRLRERIIGQDEVVELLLIALFARGHGLFVGVPGLAKTLLITTLADALSLHSNRIQFTPDLMPSDITGTDVFS